MGKPLSALVFLLVFFGAAPHVFTYAFRWEAVNHVKVGAEVVFDDNSACHGDLHTNWDGSHAVIEASGKTCQFDSFKFLSYPSNSNTPDNTPWRAILLIAAFYVALGFAWYKWLWMPITASAKIIGAKNNNTETVS